MDGAVVVQPRRITYGIVSASAAVVDLLLRGGPNRTLVHRHRSRDPRIAGSADLIPPTVVGGSFRSYLPT